MRRRTCFMTSAQLMASSMPGMDVARSWKKLLHLLPCPLKHTQTTLSVASHLLHDLGKAHRLINARDRGGQVLEEAVLGPLHLLEVGAVRGGVDLLWNCVMHSVRGGG